MPILCVAASRDYVWLFGEAGDAAIPVLASVHPAIFALFQVLASLVALLACEQRAN